MSAGFGRIRIQLKDQRGITDGTTRGSTDSDASTAPGTSSTSSSDTGDETSSSDTGCVPTCSPEHDQVLCDDVVVETCTADRYCVDGGCQTLGSSRRR